MEKKYIYGHTNFENAYEVSGYPWGFRLRTEVRYWIETLDKKNGGERFCKCTKDSRTGKWCAPKKSTYSSLEFLYLDENGHVQAECVYDANIEPDRLSQLIETHREHLSEYQIKEIKRIKAYIEVMKHVTFTVAPAPIRTEEEDKQNKAR